MNLTQKNAQESLDTIKDVMAQTRKSIASTQAGPLLVLWGLIWMIGFAVSHFFSDVGGITFLGLDIAGIAVTFVIVLLSRKHIKADAIKNLAWRVLFFWIALSLYAGIWLLILAPSSSLRIWTFITTIPMFAYVVMGLWLESKFLVWVGIGVTVVAIIGYYMFPDIYLLWMALLGGGALVSTGMYIRIRWR